MPPKAAKTGGRSKIALEVKAVTIPDNFFTYPKVRKRKRELYNDKGANYTREEVDEIVRKEYFDLNSTCKAQIWHHVQDYIKAHPRIQEIGEFCVGAEGWDWMKKKFPEMRVGRVKFKDDKFFRPWYTEAYRKQTQGMEVRCKEGQPYATHVRNEDRHIFRYSSMQR